MSRFLALLAIAAPALAQAPAAPPPGARQIRIDVSPAGQAVLKKYLGTPDPVTQKGVAQLRGIAGQMATLADAPKLDLARLRALMNQRQTLQSDLQRRGDARTLAMLGELSEADRLKFVRGLRGGSTGAAPRPAK